MKKILTMLLAAAMLFTLAACGTTPNEADSNNNNEQNDHQTETPDSNFPAASPLRKGWVRRTHKQGLYERRKRLWQENHQVKVSLY